MKQLLITLFFCFVCFLGCQTTNDQGADSPVVFGTIEYDDVYIAVNIYPTTGCFIVDQTYHLPTKEWVQNYFFTLLKKEISNKKYKLEAFDCDNYSLLANNLASKLGYTLNHQLAFGEFFYTKDTGQGHAINFFLCLENRDIKPIFFEPQTGQFIKLSEKEIVSCTYWRM